MYQNIFRTQGFPDFFAGLSPETAAAVFTKTMTDLQMKGVVTGQSFSPTFENKEQAQRAFKIACRAAIIDAIQGTGGYTISDTTTELPSIDTFFPDEIRRASPDNIARFAKSHPNLREWNNAFQKTYYDLAALSAEPPESKASPDHCALPACLTVDSARSHSLDFLACCQALHPYSDAFHLWKALHELSVFLEDTIAALNIGRRCCCLSFAKEPLQLNLEVLLNEMRTHGPVSIEQFSAWTQRLNGQLYAIPGQYTDLQTAWHDLLDTHTWIFPSRKVSFSGEVLRTINPARTAALSRERAGISRMDEEKPIGLRVV